MTKTLKDRIYKAKIAAETAFGQLYIDLDHDYKNSVFMAGSGRGGTTWVAELINFDNSYRLIFEPLFRARVPICAPFRTRQYIRPTDDDPTFLNPMTTIVSGRLRNGWADRYNRKRIARRRLIKEIRANLLLRWLYSHFPEMPIVLLVRHPCAVISSRMRLKWNYGLQTFLKQEQLMSDFLAPFRQDMEKAVSPFEIHLFHWCVETFVPLRQFKRGQIHLAFYENFCAEPRAEIGRLFSFLGKPENERALIAAKRPSSQTNRKKNRLPDRPLEDWRSRVSDQEVRTVTDVLKRFGLDSLYTPDGMPDLAAAHALFAG